MCEIPTLCWASVPLWSALQALRDEVTQRTLRKDKAVAWPRENQSGKS